MVLKDPFSASCTVPSVPPAPSIPTVPSVQSSIHVVYYGTYFPIIIRYTVYGVINYNYLHTTNVQYNYNMLFLQVPQTQGSALLDLLGGEPSASPIAPIPAPASTEGGALLDLLNLDVQQPAPPQPSAGGGADLGVGLLDLLSAPAPASGQ